MEIKPTKNFYFIKDNIKKYSGLVLEGSSRSGKTYAVLQYIVYYCIENKGKNKDVLVGRDTLKNVKNTLIKDFLEILREWEVPYLYNKTEHTFEIYNNIVKFTYLGGQEATKNAHGYKGHLIYINESNKLVLKSTFDNLEQRLDGQFILDLNPSSVTHWVYDLELRDDVKFFRTTFIDNPYCPEASRRKILSYEPTTKNKSQGTADEWSWNVYWLGLRTVGEAQIFKHWDLYEFEPSDYDWEMTGVDFGDVNPCTFVQVKCSGDDLYIREHVYESYLTNKMLAKRILDINGKTYKDDKGVVHEYKDIQDILCVCDKQEKRTSINELRECNINAIPCRKGNNSIYFGIQKLLGYKIHLHKDSLNLQHEFRNYKWLMDGDNNYVLNKSGYREAHKQDDHLIDAIRYIILYE